jgi:hypothetical protein
MIAGVICAGPSYVADLQMCQSEFLQERNYIKMAL